MSRWVHHALVLIVELIFKEGRPLAKEDLCLGHSDPDYTGVGDRIADLLKAEGARDRLT